MRRRDFLALCAAAVGCAAVPSPGAESLIGKHRFNHNAQRYWIWPEAEWVYVPSDGNGGWTVGPPIKIKPWSLDDLPAGYKASYTAYLRAAQRLRSL